VGLQILSFSRQRAINQRTALQQRVENADQRTLVVVPAQTKMFVVSRHAHQQSYVNKKNYYMFFNYLLKNIREQK